MNKEIQDLLDNIGQLVSLPAAYIRINEMVDDPKATAEDIGRVISQDPALTTRLLRVANSPLYGFSTQIETVSRAVTILGTKQIRDLALATAAVKTFEGIPNSLVSMDTFWEHSISCALCARALAMECLKSQRETLFIGGLLHDIGQLAMYKHLPDLSRQTLEACIDGPDDLENQEAEQKIIGFDHAEVGGELARRWSLPTVFQECIAYHHDPAQAKQHQVAASIVHIANSIATLVELNTTDLDSAPKIKDIAWTLTGLDKEIIEPTIVSAKAEMAEARTLLMGGAR